MRMRYNMAVHCYQLVSGLVHDDKPHLRFPCLKGLPSQLVGHVTDAECVMIPSQDEVSSPALYHLSLVSEDPCVGVPDDTTIFCLLMDHAVSLTSSDVPFRFLFKKLRMLLAFFTLLLICVFHSRFEDIVTSRYFASLTLACQSIYGLDVLPLPGDQYCLTLFQVKLHTPGGFPIS